MNSKEILNMANCQNHMYGMYRTVPGIQPGNSQCRCQPRPDQPRQGQPHPRQSQTHQGQSYRGQARQTQSRQGQSYQGQARRDQTAQNAAYTRRMNGCPDTSDFFPEETAIAMAYVPWQRWKELYEPCRALEAGTIFAELDKPFLGKGGRRR